MENIDTLLTIKDVTTVGLLLAFIVVVIGGQVSGKWFTKTQMDAKTQECSDLKEALKAATDENRKCAQDYQTSQILAARLEERLNIKAWSQPGGSQ